MLQGLHETTHYTLSLDQLDIHEKQTKNRVSDFNLITIDSLGYITIRLLKVKTPLKPQKPIKLHYANGKTAKIHMYANPQGVNIY